MKLKNNALQELYETLVSGTITISPYAESSIDKAFRECDEKLSDSVTFTHIKDLQDRNDILRKSEKTLLEANVELAIKKKQLEKENEDLLSRTHCAEDEDEALKKDNEDLRQRLMETKETLEKANSDRTELQNNCDFYHGLYVELRKDYDKIFEENKQIKKELHTAEEARNNLRAELEAKVKRMDEITKDRDIWFRKNGEKQSEIEELKKKIQSLEDDLKSKACSRDAWRTEAERLRKELTESYSDGYSDGKEEGEENLWDKLQNVNDSQPYDFDAECDGMEDVISMDLEDFLDTYRKWQEEKKKEAEEAKKKHIEYMRGYLKRYCIGRLCTNCPLHDAYKPVTSCMFSRLTDEEVEKRYRTVINARLPQSWECTMEAKVEINKDLLEKVCGIKLDEEEHKFEYGDAVRLPWRDYDYMYIGPDEKEETLVHLFDPENHAIVTSHIANVRYSGCKIIITDEDDLRFIWKDKK